MIKRPNILMIVADQLRYDCIGYANQYPVNTPHLDRMAQDGVWFENAYTPIPLCCPARQAMLNGRRPESFGALWNYDQIKMKALEPEEYSWVRDVKQCGYTTAYIGKWNVHPKYDPTNYGYDSYVGEEKYNAFRLQRYPEITYSNGWWGEIDPIPLQHTRTHWLAERAVDFLAEMNQKQATWHLRIDFPEPHLPARPSDHFAEMYSPELVPKWKGFDESFENKPYIQKQQLYNWGVENFTWEDWAPIVSRYYGVISQLDEAIGRVIHHLKQTDQYENTLIIFTSDHGDMCGSHRMMDKHYILYEDVVKVPLVIKLPGNIQTGTKVSKYVLNGLDLAPTILDILALTTKECFHGRSLLPIMLGKVPEDWRDEVVSTYNGQQFGLYSQRMILSGEWKYIWNATDIDELYHLKEDTGELQNLIYDASLSEQVRNLKRRLYEVLSREGDDLVKNPWMKRQLVEGTKL